jgi:hypothetical protein
MVRVQKRDALRGSRDDQAEMIILILLQEVSILKNPSGRNPSFPLTLIVFTNNNMRQVSLAIM